MKSETTSWLLIIKKKKQLPGGSDGNLTGL
jgi:hypothetical protein